MIFQRSLEKVLNRTKTQTRRIVKPTDEYFGSGIQQPILCVFNATTNRPRFVVGRTYAVQPGRGRAVVGRIQIASIRQEDVRTIGEADAKAEGFITTLDFLCTWAEMYDKSANFYLGSDDLVHYWASRRRGWQTMRVNQFWDWFIWQRPEERYTAWALSFNLVETKAVR